MDRQLLDRDAKQLAALWVGEIEGSGIGSPHSQVMRLISVHEEPRAREYLIERIAELIGAKGQPESESLRKDFLDRANWKPSQKGEEYGGTYGEACHKP